MNEPKSSANSLKYLLTTIIVILVSISLVGVYFAQQQLSTKATEIIKQGIDQSNGSDNSSRLISSFNANRLYIAKAEMMMATAGGYQAQVEKDIRLYASSTGVSIKDISADVSRDSTAAQTNMSNRQTKFIRVSFNNPVLFDGFIKFLQAVETNLPKLQLMNLSIEKNIGSTDSVRVDPIIIKVYLGGES